MPVTVTQTAGLLDTFGGKFVDFIDWTGPVLYAAGGEALPAAPFGCQYLLFALSATSVSGTYFTIPRPVAAGGYTTWKLMWFVSSTGAEAGAIDLSAEKTKVMGIGV